MEKDSLEIQKFTTLEVMKAIEKLDEKYRNLLLNNLQVDLITTIVNTKENYDYVIKQWGKEIEKYSLMTASIRLLADELMTPEEKVVTVVDEYASMNKEEKMDFCTKLYQDLEFQKNMCSLIIDTATKEIPEIVNVFKLFGVDFAKEIKKVLEIGNECKTYIPQAK